MPLSIRRILYIDDDPGMARLVEKTLTRRGYEVELASDAESGLRRLDETTVHVIALDHFLPTGTGLDVMSRLRARPSSPPVVYVTASAETTVAVQALKAGAVDYVPKSIDSDFLELLGSAIDQAIETARLKRAKELAEQEVRAARDRAELLLAEVNHRVANSLAMVSGLVRLQANAIKDKSCKAALAETQARIMAVAGVHRRLYTSSDVRVVEIGEYLAGLMSDLATSMKESGHVGHLELSTAPLFVPTDRAVSLGIVAIELVTNAYKYAYPTSEDGPIRVKLTADEPANRATLSVEDDGIGWKGEGPARGTGLGGRIIKAMVSSFGGHINWGSRPIGTQAVVQFPIGKQ